MLNNSPQNKTEQFSIPLNDLTFKMKSGGSARDSMWEKLNLTQKYEVCRLGQFGYLLTYVRNVSGNMLAVLKQNDKTATINVAGIINMQASIHKYNLS